MQEPSIPLTTFVDDIAPTLEQAQAAVGGLVEMVLLPDGRQMLVNEEGLLMHLPVNSVASQLSGQFIVGHAVVLSGAARWS